MRKCNSYQESLTDSSARSRLVGKPDKSSSRTPHVRFARLDLVKFSDGLLILQIR